MYVTEQVTGSFALLDSLAIHGVSYIFDYPGGAILPIYDELLSSKQHQSRFEIHQLKCLSITNQMRFTWTVSTYVLPGVTSNLKIWSFFAWDITDIYIH